ncbi:hypothetical protein ASE36_03460 [Rhizobium sp. Root274]|uniref:phosphoglycerate dehydrogenase n=1 Tax=unclassified Rhizobium TaxID=2613769 RepID=UPI000713316B|nr:MULTISPECIES: phosphoglycerate dehydrogenase [unclassified Rhizobium]KQW31332.1 hypothetical protein ASC71_03460 [Rhizobium sp. Root1240]KRD32876.1 hypothetical protein ASE36_03460 [Rhizobium sp. Root274]
MRVLVSNIMMLREQSRFEKILVENGIEPFFPEVSQFLKEHELLEIIGDFDGWLAGDDQITEAVLVKALPRLKVISKWGTGLDSIDLEAARKLGIPVYNSPGAFKDAVAEVAIAFMLDLTRHIGAVDRAVRRGLWPKPSGTGLVGKTLGIIGMGAIGQGIAKRALGMDMNVIANDAQVLNLAAPLAFIQQVELETLLQKADIVCLSCSLTSENHHMVNADSIEQMKDGAYLINVARGPLVCETDLIDALKSGKLGGAGLDVFEVEPLASDSPLKTLENVVLSSHNANNLYSATESVHANTLRNLLKGLNMLE